MTTRIGMGIARKRGNLQGLAIGFLPTDDVGIGQFDRRDNRGKADLIAAISDVEGQQVQPHRVLGMGGCGQ